jgi:cephalosporin hydroxylase
MTLLDILKEKKYDTDKHTAHDYIQTIYDPMFEVWQYSKINFLEIGVYNGESMKLWSDYFINAKNIVGVDIFERTPLSEVKDNLKDYDVNLHKFDSFRDTDKFEEFSKQYNDGFDIIIDDGHHHFESQLNTFKQFSPLMNKDGVYIIEDINFEQEGAMCSGPMTYYEDTNHVSQMSIPVIQKEIPNIRFYVTGGEMFQNQPIGIITF